jgi:septal ring factor EnvC (AmiA/AmiB activator)
VIGSRGARYAVNVGAGAVAARTLTALPLVIFFDHTHSERGTNVKHYTDEISNIAERITDLAKQTAFLLGEAQRCLADAEHDMQRTVDKLDDREIRISDLETLAEDIRDLLNAEGF